MTKKQIYISFALFVFVVIGGLAAGLYLRNNGFLQVAINSRTEYLQYIAMAVTALGMPLLFYTGYLMAKRLDT